MDCVGGAEQVLAALDAALVRAGWRSHVIAVEGSKTSGALWPLPAPSGVLEESECRRIRRIARDRVEDVLSKTQVDVIHFHGMDFYGYLPRTSVPMMATLHLPLDWHDRASLTAASARVRLVPVSSSQVAASATKFDLEAPIENGVDLNRFRPAPTRGDYALMLGRICPEKNWAAGLTACGRAGVPAVLAGAVHPYTEHIDYFEREVTPLLDGRRRFISQVSGREKLHLIANARCVLIPSVAPETSSLTALEAMACGVPVIAFRSGALRDIVQDGVTGFLVSDEREMGARLADVNGLRAQDCRSRAETCFDLQRTIRRYFERYRALMSAPMNSASSRSAS